MVEYTLRPDGFYKSSDDNYLYEPVGNKSDDIKYIERTRKSFADRGFNVKIVPVGIHFKQVLIRAD